MSPDLLAELAAVKAAAGGLIRALTGPVRSSRRRDDP